MYEHQGVIENVVWERAAFEGSLSNTIPWTCCLVPMFTAAFMSTSMTVFCGVRAVEGFTIVVEIGRHLTSTFLQHSTRCWSMMMVVMMMMMIYWIKRVWLGESGKYVPGLGGGVGWAGGGWGGGRGEGTGCCLDQSGIRPDSGDECSKYVETVDNVRPSSRLKLLMCWSCAW